MAANAQWASRPADERFWNLRDLRQALIARENNTTEVKMTMGQLQARSDEDGQMCLVGKENKPAELTHWSFGQLCTKIKATPEYLRTLPTSLAVQCVNYGIDNQESDGKAQLLLQRTGTNRIGIRSVTTDYKRLRNLDIINAVVPALDNGWMTPPARPSGNGDTRARQATEADIIPNQDNFGLAVKVGDMIAPAGVYEGDRDMFVFLVNPTRLIDDGQKGMMRGVFIWNSEVGAGAFKVQTFLLENVCGNHIVWGASEIKKIRLVHRGVNIMSFAENIKESMIQFMPTDLRNDEKMLVAARNHILGKDKDEVVENLYERKSIGLGKKDCEAAFDWAERYEKTAGSAPTTAWGFVHGLTRYSQKQTHADARHKLDVIGGKILALTV